MIQQHEKNLLALDPGELKPLRERIAQSIRDAIITGKLKPAERLLEPEVAGNLGISRTPLREAFLQLEKEGFLKVLPRKGAVVTELSLKDAEETYLIKSTLEVLAGKLAAKNISASVLTQLKYLNNKMRRIAGSEKKDYKQFLELNAQFHKLVYQASGSEKLCRIIELFRNQTLRYNYIYLSILSHFKSSVDEHDKLIKQLELKNSAGVERVIKQHSGAACKSLYEYLK